MTAGTVALFAIVLAFLAGRVRSGADPTQASAAAPAAATAPARPQTSQQAPAAPGFDPYGSSQDQQVAPGQQDQVVPQQSPAPLTTQQS